MLAVALPGLFTLPAGDRDESRFAQATKQMTETGDYLRIMNGTEPRNKKPIGIHWLQAPFVLIAGRALNNPIWPYRIPSVFGGLIAVLATLEIGLVLTKRLAIGGLAGAMLAGCVILATETHIAKTDAALLGATTLSMIGLARAWMGDKISNRQAATFWLAAAAGILLKGPITPMVLGLTTIALCLWERRARWLLAMKPHWGVPLLLLAVAPWFIAIGIATHGAFFAQAVGGDLGRKLAGGAESHGGFPGLHLVLLPLLAFPSTIPVLRALPAAWTAAWADPHDRANRFLLAWSVPSWLVFEAVPTKLPHYTLPLYPALFLLAARFVVVPPDASAPQSPRIVGRTALLTAGAVLGIAAAVLPFVLHGAWYLGLPALLAATGVTWLAWQNHPLGALAASPLLYAGILAVELPHVPALWIAPRLEAELRAVWPGWNAMGKGLAVAGYAEPSLMFTAGTDIQLFPDGEQAATALANGAATLAVVSDADRTGFQSRAHTLGIAPRDLGQVSGFNYSRGRDVTLTLLAK